jgi:hypothetical protein
LSSELFRLGGDDGVVMSVKSDKCEVSEVSDSPASLIEEPEEKELDAFRCARIVETSGTLGRFVFVVDSSANGPEIVRMSTGLSECRMLPARRGIVGAIVGFVVLLRKVKALVIDMMARKNGYLLPD